MIFAVAIAGRSEILAIGSWLAGWAILVLVALGGLVIAAVGIAGIGT